jgi:hypothetical protein
MTHCFRFFLLCPVYLFGAMPIETKLSYKCHFTAPKSNELTITYASMMFMRMAAGTCSLSPSIRCLQQNNVFVKTIIDPTRRLHEGAPRRRRTAFSSCRYVLRGSCPPANRLNATPDSMPPYRQSPC